MITSLILGGSIFILLLVIALYVVYVIGLWKLFKKAGKQGWEAIIPFYNTYMLANGIKNSTIYHNGNSVISNSTIILYIGTIEAHPGLPAFLKIFHKLTIISIEARLPPINGNVPIDDVVDTPAE